VKIAEIEELNMAHVVIADAIFLSPTGAVYAMRHAIEKAEPIRGVRRFGVPLTSAPTCRSCTNRGLERSPRSGRRPLRSFYG